MAMADAFFSKAAEQGESVKSTGGEVKTVSMGWGQEKIVSFGKESLSSQKSKNGGHYFFVRRPGL